MIAIIIVIAIIVILALVVMGSYNGLVKTKNQAEEAFSTMDVYMKKRYDLIPNLVETVKGYASHESQTLEKVTAARNAAMTASSIDEKLKNENALTGTLKSLFAVAESYPDLRPTPTSWTCSVSFRPLKKTLPIHGNITTLP